MKVQKLFGNVLLLTLFLTYFGVPSQAQEALVLYENFESKYIAPSKWIGQESESEGVAVLESERKIKTEPTYGYKGMNLLSRTYANTDTDIGSSGTSFGLYFEDGSNIKTIQATVQVKKIQMTTCSNNPTTVSESRARIAGTFFNTGTPEEGSYLNDVFALIGVIRRSDSTLPLDTLSVLGRVFICGDEYCNSSISVGSVDLGTVKVNQKIKLRVTWDPEYDRFIFQKGKGAEFHIPYTVSDANGPGGPNGGGKRIQIQHYMIPNCATDSRPFSHMEVFFDNVYVNASAMP